MIPCFVFLHQVVQLVHSDVYQQHGPELNSATLEMEAACHLETSEQTKQMANFYQHFKTTNVKA